MRETAGIALLSALLAFAVPSPAAASCASPAPLRERLGEARAAFVGVVMSTTNRGRDATVRVESVWLGRHLPPTVEVKGGPAATDLIGSVDRSWEADERYLFVLDDGAPPFRDDACSATTLYTPAVARLAPDGALAPDDSGGGGWLIVAFALLALGALQARRAMRRARGVDL